MFYNYKNCKIKINNNTLLCNDIQLSYTASLNPAYRIEKRNAFSYFSSDNINGLLKINYYLTGTDFLKKNVTANEKILLSGNFSSLYFNSGYLNNYSINAQPNSPIQASVNIIFFEDLKGVFQPTHSDIQEYDYLNFSDVTLSQFKGSYRFDNINSFTYEYNNDVKPVYFVNTGSGLLIDTPDRITYGEKTISASIQTDILSGELPIQGKFAGLTINFKHPKQPNLSENLVVSGFLYQKNFSVGENKNLVSLINIKQNHSENLPIINTLGATFIKPGSEYSFNGTYFSTTQKVTIEEIECSFVIDSDTQLTIIAPNNVRNGYIYVTNFAGKSRSPDIWYGDYSDLAIPSFY